ncbi:tRNA (N(6)-L-threonylcarbamoyladenosine(37)-C(2))-methylthiotransferase [Candidatus Woesearchaeota archaeon]|nr:tRNA (N(6)-L-threonylcarbamoyladenosine(37)-C(2))-methylthiotransferase [Candidatus Woesearchaeota archaeon]
MNVHIKTFGCSANLHDSEVVAGLLKEAGYVVADNPEEADILIISVCTVKGETKALKEIRKAKESFAEKRIVVAGCFTEKVRKNFSELEYIETNIITGIVDFLEKRKLDIKKTKINLPKIRKNPVISIVPISSGCKNKCSYCSVKLIKGELKSYPKEEILKEVKQSIGEGCKEIWITSQDNSVYGLDIYKKISLPALLKEIISLKGNFFVRIGMMNPDKTARMKKELAEVLKSDKVFKFIHIPVQSGSDRILKLMKRKYSVNNFISLVEYFREEIPGITISTDIIVGFPTETENEFNESIKLIKKIKPDVLNISRFMKREGTEAARLKQIPGGIIKSRSRTMTKVFNSIALNKNREWIGWKGSVLIDEKGKNNTSVGRNIYYRPVIINKKLHPGKIANVKIFSATGCDLRAF